MKHWQIFLFSVLVLVLAACGGGSTTPPLDSFTLVPDQTTLEVPVGGEISSFVNLNRKAGFNDVVQMTFKDLPAGFSQEWTRDAANGDCSFVLKIDPSVTPGPKTLTITGLVGDGVSSASSWSGQEVSAQANSVVDTTITVNVGPVSASNSTFTLTANPNILEVAQGGTVNLGINLNNLTSSPITADLLGLDLPSGVGVNFSSNPAEVCGTCSKSMSAQVVVGAGAPVGISTIKIRAKVGTAINTVNIKLNIKSASALTFNMVLNPSNKTFVQGLALGGTAEFGANITRLNGFTSPITLSAQNVPSGVTVQFTKPILSPTDSSSGINLGIPNTVAPGSYNLTIKAIGGNVVKTASFTFEVLSGAEFLGSASTGTNQLDTSFGTNGLSITEDFTTVVSTILLSDGKFLVTGTDHFNRVRTSRLNPDGTLDTSFGLGGNVQYPVVNQTFNPGTFNPVVVRELANGKIVIAGSFPICGIDGSCTFFVAAARINANGTPDTSFGQNGFFNTNLAVPGIAFGVFPSGDKLVLLVNLNGGEVMRLTPGGNLDPDFDGDGRKPVDLGTAITTAVLDSSNRIVAAGALGVNNPQTNVARLSLDGVLDTSFGQGGKTTVSDLGFKQNIAGFTQGAITTDSQDRVILVGGASGGAFGVVRLTTGGALDSSFDGDGRAPVVPGNNSNNKAFATGVTLQGNKIVVVGSAQNNPGASDYGAVRFNDNGSLDTSFGTGGKVAFGFAVNIVGLSPIQSRLEFLEDIVVLPDGKLMGVGVKFQFPGGGLAMVRFNP